MTFFEGFVLGFWSLPAVETEAVTTDSMTHCHLFLAPMVTLLHSSGIFEAIFSQSQAGNQKAVVLIYRVVKGVLSEPRLH